MEEKDEVNTFVYASFMFEDNQSQSVFPFIQRHKDICNWINCVMGQPNIVIMQSIFKAD